MLTPQILYPTYQSDGPWASSTSVDSVGGFQFSAAQSPHTTLTSPPRSIKSLGSPLATKFENIQLSDGEQPSPSSSGTGRSFAAHQPQAAVRSTHLMPSNQYHSSNESESALNPAMQSPLSDSKPPSKAARKRGAKNKKDDPLPNGFPKEYLLGPAETSSGKFIEEGKYECSCTKILSVESWRKNGRTHEKSEYHTNKLGLEPYQAENTVCPGCTKNFHRSDALRRHLESPSDNNSCAAAKIPMPTNKPKSKTGPAQDVKSKVTAQRQADPPHRTPLFPGKPLEETSQDVKGSNSEMPDTAEDPRSPAPGSHLQFKQWDLVLGNSPVPSGRNPRHSAVVTTDPTNRPPSGLGLVIPSPSLVHRSPHASASQSPTSARNRYRTSTPLLGHSGLSSGTYSPRPGVQHLKSESYSPSIGSARSFASNLPPCTPSIGSQAALLVEPSPYYPNIPLYPQQSIYMTEASGSSSQISSHSNGASLPPLEDDGEDDDDPSHLHLMSFDMSTPPTNLDTNLTMTELTPQYAPNAYSGPMVPDHVFNSPDNNFQGLSPAQQAYPVPADNTSPCPWTFHPNQSPQLFIEELASASLTSGPLPSLESIGDATTIHPVNRPPPSDTRTLWPNIIDTNMDMDSMGLHPPEQHNILNSDFWHDTIEYSQHAVNSLFPS